MENVVESTVAPAGQKGIFIKDLKPKDRVRTTLLVRTKELVLARNGKPYLSMIVGDKSGDVETRVWEDAEALATTFEEGDVVAVAGRLNQFQGRLQLVIESLVPLPLSEVRLADYLPSGLHDRDALYEELKQVFEELKNPWIRALARALLDDPEIAVRYKACPAAKTIHHAFIGGLLVHSLQLIRLAEAILPLYEGLDRDILIFGAAFHDFGKIYELSWEGNFGYTDEGKLVGHIAIATALIDRKAATIPGFPKPLEWQLKHLILSHHGRLEYGSPKRPHTLEAQVLHCLDDMDSKINSIQTFMKAERNGARWTAHHKAYDQYYYKPDAYLSDPA